MEIFLSLTFSKETIIGPPTLSTLRKCVIEQIAHIQRLFSDVSANTQYELIIYRDKPMEERDDFVQYQPGWPTKVFTTFAQLILKWKPT